MKKIMMVFILLSTLLVLRAQVPDLLVEGLARVGTGTATSNDAKFDVVGDNGFQVVDGIEMRSIVKFYNQHTDGGGFRFLVDPITKNACLLNGRNDAEFMFAMRSGQVNREIIRYKPNGNVGIGTPNPERKLHINDVLRLEPRETAPSSAKEGDIYMDSTNHKLMVYDGTQWQAYW